VQATNNSITKHSGGNGENPDREIKMFKEHNAQNSKSLEAYNNFVKRFRGEKK
jgi:hypothetical protein